MRAITAREAPPARQAVATELPPYATPPRLTTIEPVTTDECIGLTDDELVDATYAVVDELAESDDERTAQVGGTLIFLLGELLDALDGLRRRQAARLLRDTLSG